MEQQHNNKLIFQISISVISGLTLFLLIGLLGSFRVFLTDINSAIENSDRNSVNIIEINKSFDRMADTMVDMSDELEEMNRRTMVLQEKALSTEEMASSNSRRIDVLYMKNSTGADYK